MKKFLSYLRLSWEMVKVSIQNKMEYRFTFFAHVIGMFINDLAILSIWWIFFTKFPQVRGWTFESTAVLFAYTSILMGVVTNIAHNTGLARMIAQGELDYFLSFPKNVLWHISLSRIEIAGLGNILAGVLFYSLFGNTSLEAIVIACITLLLGSAIFFNFIILTQSIAFFVGNFEEAAEQLFSGVLAFAIYPQNYFHGSLKLIMMTILPAFFIVTLPMTIIIQFQWHLLGLLFIAFIISSLLAQFIFKKGLQKYESGNLITIRT